MPHCGAVVAQCAPRTARGHTPLKGGVVMRDKIKSLSLGGLSAEDISLYLGCPLFYVHRVLWYYFDRSLNGEVILDLHPISLKLT